MLRKLLAIFLIYLLPILLTSVVVLANGETMSPNMGLVVPGVGTTIGPDWANDLNASLGIIDAHDHTPGNGVQIPPGGIDINTSLPFNGNMATSLGAGVFTVQGSNPACLDCVFSKGVDLYYIDGNGNAIQLTKSGGPNAGTGNISGLPSTPTGGAGVAWQNSQGTFQFTQDSGSAGGNADIGTLILRYAGSYPTPSGNFIAIEAPTSLATGYSFTLPNNTPGANGSMLTSSTSGVISYTTPDGVGTAMTSTGANAVANSRTRATGTSVGAGGVAVSADSGTYVLTSTPTAVPNLSVTITTTGRPVHVGLISSGNISLDSVIQVVVSGSLSSGITAHMDLYRGSTFLSGQDFGNSFIVGSGAGGFFQIQNTPVSTVNHVDVIAAGTYTYTLKSYYSDISGSAGASLISAELVAYEL